jgi:hypothetical protein
MNGDTIKLEDKVRCVHQVYQRARDVTYEAQQELLDYTTTNGGDCSVCSYDVVNNPLCSRYHPILYVGLPKHI